MKFHQSPLTFVSQVDINVSHLERSLEFYKSIIGFDVLQKSENEVLLTADGKRALLKIEQPDDVTPKQPHTTGLYHFAILLPNRTDLAQIVEHLNSHKIPFGSSDHLVSEALYLSDPDGNGIEIYVDRPESSWSWQNKQVTMTVDPLNFEDLLQEKKEGEVWNGLPKETIMGHIHLHVAHLPVTEEFYTKVLGFNVVCRYGNQALFISSGDYHHHIGLNTWAGVGASTPPKFSVGLKQFTLEYPNDDSRDRVVENLKKLGAMVQIENGHLITRDPSGNQIKLSIAK